MLAGGQVDLVALGLCFVRNRAHRTILAAVFNVRRAGYERYLALVALDRLALCFAVVRQPCIVQIVALKASCTCLAAIGA